MTQYRVWLEEGRSVVINAKDCKVVEYIDHERETELQFIGEDNSIVATFVARAVVMWAKRDSIHLK